MRSIYFPYDRKIGKVRDYEYMLCHAKHIVKLENFASSRLRVLNLKAHIWTISSDTYSIYIQQELEQDTDRRQFFL